MVHKHAARHLHYDLRLEMDGVLRSWAVPKGPSYDQRDKRLAVHVEDHPLEYGDFEGLIPEGNYGAGAVIVWDRGEWIPLEDPTEGLAKGKLLFELRGYKLRGTWALVKLKKSKKEWLLIKERDRWLRTERGDDFPPESVLSGLTVEQLKAGELPSEVVRRELERLGAVRRRVDVKQVEPMLAEPRETAFSKPGWVFELKLDGYRLLASRGPAGVRLQSRNGNDFTATFPEVARAVQALAVPSAVFDGELVVLDQAGRPSFQALQKRGRLSRPLEIRIASLEAPATYFVFDLLGFEEFDLRPLPLSQRKRLLAMLVPTVGPVRYLDHFESNGEALLEQVTGLGLEGVVAKRADAPYKAGRSPVWLKIRSDRTADFAVVGFTPPKGSRAGIGALLLADRVKGALVFAGRVGSGFTDQELRRIHAELQKSRRGTPLCDGPVGSPESPPRSKARGGGKPAGDWTTASELKGCTWVEPSLVCEVRFKEWTEEGLLRHPVFLRWRDDKSIADVETRRSGAAAPGEDPPRPVRRAAEPPSRRAVEFTNLKKVFWPEEHYTKGDLIDYYRDIGPWLLPYLKDRPVVLTRYPDGIEGKSFYQKDAPDFVPAWIRTTPIWSEDTSREIRYFVCDDLETLLYLANLGTIPLHLWSSRVGSLERPDWCVLDLDPKEAPFEHVVTIARRLHQLCEDAGLPNFIKTTGKTGLHVMIPLGRQCTYEHSRTLGELLARLVLAELREIATITRHVQRRGAKVYLDYLQNRHGQLIAAPFSVRPLPGAPVSMPLEWKEVNASLDPRQFTIRSAVARMKRRKRDPLAPVLELAPDLVGALDQLSRRVRS